MDLDTITTQFYNAGLHYSAEGQLEPSFFLGRMIKHILSGGFVYLMIVNGLSWMYMVIQSFSRIGAAISGLPALSPQSVLASGLNMTNTLTQQSDYKRYCIQP